MEGGNVEYNLKIDLVYGVVWSASCTFPSLFWGNNDSVVIFSMKVRLLET